MTDRELLEMAAKAAGISGAFENGVIWYKNEFGDDAGFNPLTDDGAALRLAVKLSALGGGVCLMLNSRLNSIGFAQCYTSDHVVAPHEYMGDDPFAATRRAIVRAAAEIGREMP